MSEYWKSLPRKFCDICKCWFADNKASIEFHERGKRHQENAAKRIQDIQKRGLKEAKKQKKLEDDMAKIEKAALAAYKKDIQNQSGSGLEMNNIDKLTQDLSNIPETKPAVQFKPKKNKEKKAIMKTKNNNISLKSTSKIWYEAVTEDGNKYYWNAETSESKWESPKEGYISLEEQTQSSSENVSEVTSTEKIDKQVTCSIGPQPKIDPYGQWITIEHKKVEEIDLQLPKPSEDVVEVVIPIAKDEPKLKIKEKIIGQLSDIDPSEEVTFKKRKFIGSAKRNTRPRTTDD